MNTNRPIHEVSLGNIRATIWPNQKDQKTWYAVTFARRFRQGSEWKDANSFNHDDLPVVAKAAQMAYDWLWQQAIAARTQEEA